MSLESHDAILPYKLKEKTDLGENALEVFEKLVNIDIKGAENLKEIPEHKHIIFLVTHLSDIDVPVAIAALQKLGIDNTKVAVAESHTDISWNAGGYISRWWAGVKNTFTVSQSKKGAPEKNVFAPSDFPPMREALQKGQSIVMAAYLDRKTQYKDKKWRLPAKGGNGGVYLANMTPDTVIVPIAVDFETEPFGMGDAGPQTLLQIYNAKVNVHFGKHIQPRQIEGVEELPELIRKISSLTPVSAEDRTKYERIHEDLQSDSRRVMSAIEMMLPPEKGREHQPPASLMQRLTEINPEEEFKKAA